MNNYSIPMELATARQQREDAWKKYNDLIDAGKQELANEFFPMVVTFEETAAKMYVEWMTKGGTSDIDSLTFPDRIPADVRDIVRWQNEPDFEDEPKEVQPKVDFTKIKPIQF
jgi:hypothetical protein